MKNIQAMILLSVTTVCVTAQHKITITDGSKLSAYKATDFITQNKIILEGSAAFIVRNGSTSNVNIFTSSDDIDLVALKNRLLMLEQTVEGLAFDGMSEVALDTSDLIEFQQALQLLQMKLETQQEQLELLASSNVDGTGELLGDEAMRLETRLAVLEARVNTMQRQLDRLVRLQINSRDFEDEES